jgi:sugar lactone lactonase YvrE
MPDMKRYRAASRRTGLATLAALVLAGGLAATTAAAAPRTSASSAPFLAAFHTISKVASTVSSLGTGKGGNGDVNPYGVAVVPRSVGRLVAGDVLVSNFNAASNLQGTGSTIMQISPKGKVSVFADLSGQVRGRIGLTTALSVFANGDVVVGSLPTSNGKAATATAGALYVLNSRGKVIETLSGGGINGPWDMTSFTAGEQGVLFVTNVLNHTVASKGAVVHDGTVLRLVLDLSVSPPKLEQDLVIGKGFPEETNAAALVVGPTGLALSPNGTLYVADTLASRITAIPDALFRTTSDATGTTVSSGEFLSSPLGLATAPNGDILSVNAANGYIVETTPTGTQTEWIYLDSTGSPPGAGALFGLAVQPGNKGVYFVDDDLNTLQLFH